MHGQTYIKFTIGKVSSINYLTASMLISLLCNLLLCHLLRYVTNYLIALLLCPVSDILISVGKLVGQVFDDYLISS